MRRSLFTNEAERTKFLHHLVTGTRDILRARQGLTEHENYHEFCRLLGRLKTNYQLSELVRLRRRIPSHRRDRKIISLQCSQGRSHSSWVLSTGSCCEASHKRKQRRQIVLHFWRN